jgi:vacuolar-type H+-ATPase subunit I/STV1
MLSIVFLVMLFGCISGYFLWLWHVDQIDQQNGMFQKKNRAALSQLMSYTTELERLLIMVTPKVFDQVLAARELTEQEISILIRRFSAMLDELQQIIDFANQAQIRQSSNSIASLRSNAEKIRGEIDVVLEALQFQDRVSQILSQVESNLTNLKKTVEKIQSTGSDRNQNLIKVEAMLAKIESNYESVNHLPIRSVSENAVDELTFF